MHRHAKVGNPATPPTIYDVARECGLATSTVSRAFSKPGRVSTETEARVRQVAARLGYRTNPLARALPTGKTSMIALVVSDITNPVYFAVIRGAERQAAVDGYTMILTDSQESAAAERMAIERSTHTVEGVLLATSRMSDLRIRMAAKQRPLIVMNRSVADVVSVITDNEGGMRRAVEHLSELGHETITYLAGPRASWADGARWRALRSSAEEFGMRVRQVGPHPPTVTGGFAAAAEFLRRPTTAAVAYNDLLAIGLIRGLTQAGFAVPRDVSIVGCDNIFGSDFCTPALTTIAAPLGELGATAARMLLSQLRGQSLPTGQPVVLPTRLVERESTAPRRRTKGRGDNRG